VIVSRRQGTVNQYSKIEEGGGFFFFTRVGQHRDDGLRVANLWFRELEMIANVTSSTMDGTDPRGKFDLFALAGGVFVDVHDMVWAVGTMEIDHL